MYGIFTYIWLLFMVNVGKYAIHGSYGNGSKDLFSWDSKKIGFDNKLLLSLKLRTCTCKLMMGRLPSFFEMPCFF